MADASQLDELVGFLSRSTPVQAMDVALDYVVGLTGSADGLTMLRSHHKILFALLDLLEVEKLPSMDLVFRALVNISADSELKVHLTSQSLEYLLAAVLRRDYVFADGACMILSNVTREEAGACMLSDVMLRSTAAEDVVPELVNAFCDLSYNTAKCTLDYMATLLANITQVPAVRLKLTHKDRCLLQQLLPFTGYQASKVRRGGIIGVIRNCCFDPGVLNGEREREREGGGRGREGGTDRHLPYTTDSKSTIHSCTRVFPRRRSVSGKVGSGPRRAE